jgi:hypothetical protein
MLLHAAFKAYFTQAFFGRGQGTRAKRSWVEPKPAAHPSYFRVLILP